jgi:hypothetical protein
VIQMMRSSDPLPRICYQGHDFICVGFSSDSRGNSDSVGINTYVSFFFRRMKT